MDFLSGLEREIELLPAWVASLGILAAFIFAGLLVHRLVFSLFQRVVGQKDLFWRSLVARTERLGKVVTVAFGLHAAALVAPLTPGQASSLRHLLLVCLIVLVAWIIHNAMHIWSVVYLRRFQLDTEDNLLARKHVTQFRIMRRIANSLLIVLAAAAVLMTFENVRQYGVSLLASAGAAGIVVGLALQPVLKNLLAGVQLAITQPIRIDDAILVEGEFGRVEEITSTYVVVKLWDWRRLVLPLNYFMENPFQNWTRESAPLIGSMMVYLDYTMPVDVVRTKVEEIASRSVNFDGKVLNVAVTDLRENVMQIRVLASAADSGRAFDLRCEMREQLIDFVQQMFPNALPRLRLEETPSATSRHRSGNWQERTG
ncbi:mechanosensitive ion channel family protein [Ensifer sp. LCM 4579]|uniref:mechanosensitive ion channel family protein n=1 Tax=Ensifer sp. LCM 4579 TaxID=1848292 RepID=UPI0008DA3249|nr:mechanosensitive ion channel family protein [Ensifer sp. LCM 4579]OHV79898.1 mechanosensitive ion channel protein MscS [Ensifer sp. LCM 4579]